jgi:hypothetical protein
VTRAVLTSPRWRLRWVSASQSTVQLHVIRPLSHPPTDAPATPPHGADESGRGAAPCSWSVRILLWLSLLWFAMLLLLLPAVPHPSARHRHLHHHHQHDLSTTYIHVQRASETPTRPTAPRQPNLSSTAPNPGPKLETRSLTPSPSARRRRKCAASDASGTRASHDTALPTFVRTWRHPASEFDEPVDQEPPGEGAEGAHLSRSMVSPCAAHRVSTEVPSDDSHEPARSRASSQAFVAEC